MLNAAKCMLVHVRKGTNMAYKKLRDQEGALNKIERSDIWHSNEPMAGMSHEMYEKQGHVSPKMHKKHGKKKETAREKKIHKVMKEYKHGKLHAGSKKGPQVKKRAQAVAIALSEARRMKKKHK